MTGPNQDTAQDDPGQLVSAFLSAMEARDLPKAQKMLAPGFTMQFPGAPLMTTLSDLIAWAKPRYQHVQKTYDGIDTLPGGIVYLRGTLFGQWTDGTSFSGIRFIDRFEVSGGLITKQEVWNDLAETKAQA